MSDLSADDPRVRADDELVQRLADGAMPPTGDPVGDRLAWWREEIDQPAHSPALAQLPDAHWGDPTRNPIAFLPSADGPEGVVRYGDEVDYQWPYGRHALRDHLPIYASVEADTREAEPWL